MLADVITKALIDPKWLNFQTLFLTNENRVWQGNVKNIKKTALK